MLQLPFYTRIIEGHVHPEISRSIDQKGSNATTQFALEASIPGADAWE